MSSDEQLANFIKANFPSVWTLELLLLLRRERGHLSKSEMVTALRASDLVIHQALQSLMAGGLAITDADGGAYAPATPELKGMVDETASFYAAKPDAVRRLIVTSASRGLTDFADAFRWRKD